MLTVDVHAALLAAGYESHVVDDIIRTLTAAQSTVRQGKDLPAVPAASYGTSPSAGELGVHARKAHDHLVEAMSRMVAGLESYHAGVEMLRRGAHDADERNAADLQGVARRTQDVKVAAMFRRGDACTSNDAAAACVAPTQGRGR